MDIEKKADTYTSTKTFVDGIPVCCILPQTPKGIALWIPYLGGSKEACEGELTMLAQSNYAAISIDPWMHGERALGKDIRADVFQQFRKTMWQVLGLTVFDCFKVIDWAVEKFGIEKNIVAGGASMGGDIAIALAGIDTRIKRVSGIASSPVWYRKGMRDVMDPMKEINQGEPGPFSQYLCDLLNPVSNTGRFTRDLKIHLEFGKKDMHIHSSWANEFVSKLGNSPALNNKPDITILESEDSDHIALIQNRFVIKRAIDFLVN